MVPMTSQENRILKRMNNIIMEHARCMRLHDDFPLQLWDNVIEILIYLINKEIFSSLDGGILEEAWEGKTMNFIFCKVFGYEYFVHIDKKNRKKLDNNSKKYYFIGYRLDSLGHIVIMYSKKI